jgi:hypothetical protein
MVLTKTRLTGIAGALLIAGIAAFGDVGAEPMAAWQQLASPGDLSAVHRHLEKDCGACHTAVEGASRSKCMACHAQNERLLTWPQLKFHASVPDCRACHPDHQGMATPPIRMDHVALAKMAPDRPTVLECESCHAGKDAHRQMFGSDCGSCHGIAGWSIANYRHPSNDSPDCAQCHRPPPCHATPHFKKVCATVAGEPNAAVRDCQSCHQATGWNQIRGVGWYQSH